MAEKIKHYNQLEVWKKSHQLTLQIYQITKSFPAEERFGLVSQMRRAAVSVPANIVEGFRRRSNKEKLRFYGISQSSADELSYFLILSQDLGYLKNIESESKWAESIVMMLAALMRTIQE